MYNSLSPVSDGSSLLILLYNQQISILCTWVKWWFSLASKNIVTPLQYNDWLTNRQVVKVEPMSIILDWEKEGLSLSYFKL